MFPVGVCAFTCKQSREENTTLDFIMQFIVYNIGNCIERNFSKSQLSSFIFCGLDVSLCKDKDGCICQAQVSLVQIWDEKRKFYTQFIR